MGLYHGPVEVKGLVLLSFLCARQAQEDRVDNSDGGRCSGHKYLLLCPYKFVWVVESVSDR